MPRKKRPSPFSDDLIDSLLEQGDPKQLLSPDKLLTQPGPDLLGLEAVGVAVAGLGALVGAGA